MKSYSQALKILKENKIKINDENINSSKGLNRVSSVNIYSNSDYPSANNASFDGYAIKSKDTNKLNDKIYQKFKIIGSIAAKAILKNKFVKKINFTRFIKGKLSTTSNGKMNITLLPGQESFRIKSFTKSNAWAVLPSGKSRFKKGEIIDCFLVNQLNKNLL